MLIMNKWRLNWANCGCVVILSALAIGVIVAIGPTLLFVIGAFVFGVSIESGLDEPGVMCLLKDCLAALSQI